VGPVAPVDEVDPVGPVEPVDPVGPSFQPTTTSHVPVVVAIEVHMISLRIFELSVNNTALSYVRIVIDWVLRFKMVN
jgi:hypothetical protein